jgi:hypothetical protein
MVLTAIGVITCVIFSVVFGVALYSGDLPPYTPSAAAATILFLALWHAAERWNRHACDNEPFWEF